MCSPSSLRIGGTGNLPAITNPPPHERTSRRTRTLVIAGLCSLLASTASYGGPGLANDMNDNQVHAAGSDGTTPPPAAPDESTPIRVVVALPLTGPRHGIGAAARPRLSLVKSAIDANGGIARRPLQLEILDDGCARDAARQLATQIVAMTPPPAAVIGHPCASAATTAAPIYQKAGVLFLAAGVRHPLLSDPRAGPLVFRAAGRDDRQGVDAGRRLRALAGDSGTSLVIHDRTVLTRSLAKAARESAISGSQALPAELPIVAGETDYTKTIDEITSRAPNAILFLGFPSEAAIILRQLRARGNQVPFVVNDAMATAEFIDHAGDLLETDVEVMMPVSITRDILAESESPDALAASDIATALSIWQDAVTATAGTDATQIAQRLSAPRSQLEEVGFDSAGDAIVPSFAPFRRHDNAWQRADLATGGKSAPPPAQVHSTTSQSQRQQAGQ